MQVRKNTFTTNTNQMCQTSAANTWQALCRHPHMHYNFRTTKQGMHVHMHGQRKQANEPYA